MIQPSVKMLPPRLRPAAALLFAARNDVALLTPVLVGADKAYSHTEHVPHRIRDEADVKRFLQTGVAASETMRLVEKMLLPRIWHAGYRTLEDMVKGMDAVGNVVPQTLKPWPFPHDPPGAVAPKPASPKKAGRGRKKR